LIRSTSPSLSQHHVGQPLGIALISANFSGVAWRGLSTSHESVSRPPGRIVVVWAVRDSIGALSERLRFAIIHSQYDRLQELPVMNNSTRERGSPLGCFPDQTTPKLYDRMAEVLRAQHYIGRAEEAYVHWIHLLTLFHAGEHPREPGEGHVNIFLTHLAVKKVAASSAFPGSDDTTTSGSVSLAISAQAALG
jgi:hypothetical protein